MLINIRYLFIALLLSFKEVASTFVFTEGIVISAKILNSSYIEFNTTVLQNHMLAIGFASSMAKCDMVAW